MANAAATTFVTGLVQATSVANHASGAVQTNGVLTATAVQWNAITGGSGGLTTGSVYFLSPTMAGQITTTAPTTSGQYVVQVGIALSTTELDVQIGPPILLGTVTSPSTMQPVQPVIASNLSLYVATTGNDTTGNGTVGNPWASLGKAISYLNSYAIAPNATVTIYLGDGTYSTGTAVNINHPNGAQINITGTNIYTTTLSGSITSFAIPSGGSASAVINVASSANMAVNDYILISNATGGSHGWLLNGCHKITNIASNAVTISVKSWSSNQASGAITGNITTVKSILTFTGGVNGIVIQANPPLALGLLDKVILVGNGSGTGLTVGCITCGSSVGITTWNYGLVAGANTLIIGSNLCCSGCVTGLYISTGAAAVVQSTVANGCSAGFTVTAGSKAIANNSNFVGNSSSGAYISYGSSAQLNSSVACDNGGTGFYITNTSAAYLNSAVSRYNVGGGVTVQQTSSGDCTSCVASNNGNQGYLVSWASFATLGSATANANSNHGIWIANMSSAWVGSCTSTSNTGYGIIVQNMSHAAGCGTSTTLSGNSSGTVTPAISTTVSGNVGSFTLS